MTTPPIKTAVAANYSDVLDRVRSAVSRCGRREGDVQIVGVTKYVDSAQASLLVDAGCLDLGESRPQLLWQKHSELQRPDIRWHLIGHLQRNKVAKTLEIVDTIHSVDSIRLLEQIIKDSSYVPAGKIVKLLAEVNVTADATKTGLRLQEAEALFTFWCNEAALGRLPSNLQLSGLMGMASLGGNEAAAKSEFELVREFRDTLSQQYSMQLPDLSMGMSGDFEWAIECGSTLVRIGSSLFK